MDEKILNTDVYISNQIGDIKKDYILKRCEHFTITIKTPK